MRLSGFYWARRTLEKTTRLRVVYYDAENSCVRNGPYNDVTDALEEGVSSWTFVGDRIDPPNIHDETWTKIIFVARSSAELFWRLGGSVDDPLLADGSIYQQDAVRLLQIANKDRPGRWVPHRLVVRVEPFSEAVWAAVEDVGKRELRRAALAKLTAEEREALGVTDDG